MQISIQIVQVGEPYIPDGKTYRKMDVTFKQDGKIQAKSLIDFNAQDVFETIAGSKPGDILNIVIEKKGQFWNWTAASKAVSQPVAAPVPTQEYNQANFFTQEGAVLPPPKKQWLPEEDRQRMIVRQSTLDRAIEYVEKFYHPLTEEAAIEAVLKYAKLFEDHVYGVEIVLEKSVKEVKPKVVKPVTKEVE